MTVFETLTSWKFWLTVIVGSIIILYLIFGGKRDYEVVGLRFLSPNYYEEGPRYIPVEPLLPRYVGAHISPVASPVAQSPIVEQERYPPAILINENIGYGGQLNENIGYEGQLNEGKEIASPREYIYSVVTPPREAAPMENRYIQPEMPSPPPIENIPPPPYEDEPVFNIRYKSIPEELSCRALGNLLQAPIINNAKLEELRNPDTGRKLELDCWCEQYRVSVEFDGLQHSQFVPGLQKTYDNYLKQVKNDRMKDALCMQHGIKLLRVPYYVDNYKQTINGPKINNKLTQMERYIRVKDYLRHHLPYILNYNTYNPEPHYTTHFLIYAPS